MPAPFPEDADDLLRRTFAHAAWADARIAAALTALPDPPAQAVRLFAHLAGAARLWLARIEGTASPLAVWPDLSPATAARHLAHAHAAFDRRLARGVALSTPVAYVNSKGEAFTNTLGDVLTHVALHGAHHRGQILADLRAAGHPPPYVDFIGFARAPER